MKSKALEENMKSFGKYESLVRKWCEKNKMTFVLEEFKELFDNIAKAERERMKQKIMDTRKVCCLCREEKDKYNLERHHIRKGRTISLCVDCHKWIHGSKHETHLKERIKAYQKDIEDLSKRYYQIEIQSSKKTIRIDELQKENEELKGIWKLEESIAQTRAKEIAEECDEYKHNIRTIRHEFYKNGAKKMKQEKVDKRCIELLKKAMGKEYDNVSEIAIRKTLELSPILQNQLELFSYNDICKWFDDVVKITAKAKDEEDKFSVKIWQIRIKEFQKEIEKLKQYIKEEDMLKQEDSIELLRLSEENEEFAKQHASVILENNKLKKDIEGFKKEIKRIQIISEKDRNQWIKEHKENEELIKANSILEESNIKFQKENEDIKFLSDERLKMLTKLEKENKEWKANKGQFEDMLKERNELLKENEGIEKINQRLRSRNIELLKELQKLKSK